jgi:hypothetical protein
MPGPYDQANGSFNVPFITENKNGNYNPRQQGVFAQNPLMTPKYSRFKSRDAEYRDTLARLYISLPLTGDPTADATVRENYLNSLPNDASTRALADVLLSGNGAAGSGAGYIDFFLTQVQESFQEIVQIDKVLADDYVAFFYGQSPPQFQYSGMLLNSMQDDQRSGFARVYEYMLRGTQLARRGALARLRYDSVIVSGTMIAHQQQLIAENELAVPFSFTFLVKEYVVLNNAQFTRLEPADFVALEIDAALAALGPVESALKPDRTEIVTPDNSSSVSVVGPGTTTPGAGSEAPTTELEQKAINAQKTKEATSNIKGTIQTEPPPSPPPPAPSAPPFAAPETFIDTEGHRWTIEQIGLDAWRGIPSPPDVTVTNGESREDVVQLIGFVHL